MNKLRFRNSILLTTLFVSLLWCVKSAEILFHWDLGQWGVTPMSELGLVGILAAPLIHGSLEHLFNNTLPMLILGSILLYGYPRSRWRVIALVWLLSGIGVWLFARDASHIGASGLIHGIFFYLLMVSILRRDKRSVAIMMIAFFMYGGMTMSIFPSEEGISFEYHFFGALSGVVSALLWHNLDPKLKEKTYSWQIRDTDDPFIGDQWQEPQVESEAREDEAPSPAKYYH